MKRGLVILGLLCTLTLSACAGDPGDLGGALHHPGHRFGPGDGAGGVDDHGGFHGDGARWVVISLAGADQAPAFSQEAGWHATPCRRNWRPSGMASPGRPTRGRRAWALSPRGVSVPQVESGYYFSRTATGRRRTPGTPPTSSPGMHITSPPPSMTPGARPCIITNWTPDPPRLRPSRRGRPCQMGGRVV